MKKYLWWIIVIFFSCEGTNGPISHVPVSPESKQIVSKETGEFNISQKIIKEGNIRFKTHMPDSTAQIIKRMVKKYKGLVVNEEKQNMRISHSEKEISYRMEIKIPATNLDAFLSELDRIAGTYDYKNIRSQDVTERYIDLEARLKAKRQLKERLNKLLERAQNIDEIIRLEKELSRLQAEIESLEGQIRYLNDRTAYSRLNIEFYKRIISSPRFFARLGEAFKNGWIIFQYFLLGLVNLWIFILAGLGIWWLWKWKRHRFSSPG